MYEGCDHCGTVVRSRSKEAVECPDCGRRLRRLEAFEARSLTRERRIAEQFRRVTQLRHTMNAGRLLKPR